MDIRGTVGFGSLYSGVCSNFIPENRVWGREHPERQLNSGLIKVLFSGCELNEIQHKLKIWTYGLIKTEFSAQNYIKFNLPKEKKRRDVC